ncbi:hypothetical protein [Streptomyces sp. NBRC 110611]|uniref:hypothetical protein n=1 Tax=Streptomyces sp. NBRC 110611 TaxID=1621259 RepID=UPI0008359786|nr:hypothetical protein [Streptomyces sp. NBRC 110611]
MSGRFVGSSAKNVGSEPWPPGLRSTGSAASARSAPTEYAFDVAGIVWVTARKANGSEVNEIFRHVAATRTVWVS